jgi:hypothetical protein
MGDIYYTVPEGRRSTSFDYCDLLQSVPYCLGHARELVWVALFNGEPNCDRRGASYEPMQVVSCGAGTCVPVWLKTAARNSGRTHEGIPPHLTPVVHLPHPPFRDANEPN